MQRRAAAIYVALFVVLGAASYSLIATAQAPTISFENPEHRLSQGDSFSVGNEDYTVSSISAEVESGGGAHGGGGGGLVRSGEVSWVNESSLYTTEWDNGATVTYESDEWVVQIANDSDPSSFTLVENVDRAGILANDTAADNETVTRDGEEFVVVTENGTSRLVPASEYFPAPETQEFTESDTIRFENNQTRIDVASDVVTLSYNAPATRTASLPDEGNVTLSGQQYLVYFPTNTSVVLTQNYDSYNEQVEAQHQFTTHKNGLWGVTILSAIAAFFLIVLAYLPSRY